MPSTTDQITQSDANHRAEYELFVWETRLLSVTECPSFGRTNQMITTANGCHFRCSWNSSYARLIQAEQLRPSQWQFRDTPVTREWPGCAETLMRCSRTYL